MDKTTMFKISYGLYVLSAHEDGFHNGCIINTFGQVTDIPLRVSVTVNKDTKTCEMIKNTGIFNVSILSEKATFDIFKHFGFQSGREVNKFADFEGAKRADNGLYYITTGTNAYVSAEVFETVDLGTHLMFMANVTDAVILNQDPSATYDYYHKAIKPQPQQTSVKGYRCKICGYIYEGSPLPENYICPICKHGPADFEEIK